MSKEAFVEFLAKASEDQALEAQLDAATAANSIVALGAANGFTFSEEDMKAGALELNEMNEGELTQEQLAEVSGGGWFSAVFKAIKIGVKVYKTGAKLGWW